MTAELGLRDFYQRYIHRFFKRRGLVAVTGEHGSLDTSPFPLGYSEFDFNEGLGRMRKVYDKTAQKYNQLG